MQIKIPILKIGSKDENGTVHTEDSLKSLEKEFNECEYKEGILYFKRNVNLNMEKIQNVRI